MDKYGIDNHKLIYHIPRVNKWLQGINIYPIYIEIGLYGGCNHRCIFCAFRLLEYKPSTLDTRYLKDFILEAAAMGVKSVLYSGEGEPLLHKDVADIIVFTKKSGIDVALATNGVMFDKDKANRLLRHLSWLKFSLDASCDKTYALIHGTRKDDFNIVMRNIKEAVKIRNRYNHNCTIGVQFLLLPQNCREVKALAKIMGNIGVDYLVIKPYSQHRLNSKIQHGFNYNKFFYLEKEMGRYERNGFQIIFRRHAMEKLGENKPYRHCLALPFATCISTEGDMFPCNYFLGKKEFAFGNIYKENFKKIWNGKKRKKVMGFIYNKLDTESCRRACRLDNINRYLWELKNPNSHVNFI